MSNMDNAHTALRFLKLSKGHDLIDAEDKLGMTFVKFGEIATFVRNEAIEAIEELREELDHTDCDYERGMRDAYERVISLLSDY